MHIESISLIKSLPLGQIMTLSIAGQILGLVDCRPPTYISDSGPSFHPPHHNYLHINKSNLVLPENKTRQIKLY